MSIGLVVQMTHPIVIRELLPKIGVALQEILALSFRPEILGQEYADRKWGPLQSDHITAASRLIGFEVRGESEIVAVCAHVRGGDHRTRDEHGIFMGIEVVGQRTPLEFALTAAVAIAVGRQCRADVTDNMPFFSVTFDQPADTFASSIKLQGVFDDYRVAAQVFYDSLPGNAIPSTIVPDESIA